MDIRLLIVSIGVIASIAVGEPSTEGPPDSDSYTLPVRGTWLVLRGGEAAEHEGRPATPSFGVDLGKVGGRSGQALFEGRGEEVEDYYCWDQPVLAPVQGHVMEVVQDLPDQAPGMRDTRHPAGNHVVIQVAPDRYVFLTHLRQRSVAVTPGQWLGRGQPVGRCGNSGDSAFPHLHVRVQTSPVLNDGEGVDPVFAGLRVQLNGMTVRQASWPLTRGLYVSPES